MYSIRKIFAGFYYWFLAADNKGEFEDSVYHALSTTVVLAFFEFSYLGCLALLLLPIQYLDYSEPLALALWLGVALANFIYFRADREKIFNLVRIEYIENEAFTTGRAPKSVSISVIILLVLLIAVTLRFIFL